MAKLDRKDVKIFAENSKETLITEFRTEDPQGFTASFSRDPDVIQNENYSQGWVNDTNNYNTKIYGEDLNAVNYVLSYLLKYLYENGIAEWNSTTTYYQNSIVKNGSDLYISLEDDNTGNDPTSTVSYWKLIPTDTITTQDAGVGYSIVKALSGNNITFKTLSVTGYGTLTDNGDQLNINIAGGGGGGGGDAFWGMIQGTITNQTDLINLINGKQNVITCSTPLVLSSSNDISIGAADSSNSGYLTSTDWNTFNNKQNTVSATLPISISSNNITIATAGTNTTGALSYTDWNTFNSKQNALSFSSPLSETSGTVSISKADTSTSGYLDSTDWNTFSGKQNAIQGVTFSYDSTNIKQEPDSNRTSYIGSPSYPYNYVYSANITSDNYKNNINYTNLQTTFTDFNFGSTYYYNQGTNNEMSILNIQSVYDGDTNTITDILPQKTNSSKIHICNLGSSTQKFGEGYFISLNATSSVTTPEIKGLTSSSEITLANSLISESGKNVSLGSSSNGMYEGWIQFLKTNQIKPFTGSDTVVQTNLKDSSGGAHNIGNNDNYFAGVYAGGFVTRPSDVREKENIENYKNSVLEKLDKLNPMTYTIKGSKDGEVKFGLSAQELQEIEPLCVVGSETKSDEKLGIELYATLTLAMQAIKELNEKVKSLEARVEELEGKKELEK